MKTIYHIIVKELLQLRRDKRMFGLSIMAPIIQLLLLGYAATTDVDSIPLVVYDQDGSSTSREVISRFTNSGYFILTDQVHDYSAIDRAIEHGKVWIAVVIPPQFGADVGAHRTARIQLVIDGSDATTANVSMNYATQILGAYGKSIVTETMMKTPAPLASVQITPEIRVWYNADLKSRNFMVPGVVALVLMIVTMTLTSLGIVKEKESGTLEQLLVTPIKPYQLILGKLIPFISIGFVDVTLVLFVARFWFQVPLRGSIFLLYGLSGLFILTTLGLGLFVSTISKTQQQAMMTAQFFIFMPFIFLSGFTFPIENMPQIIQYITYIIPLRYFITIIRGLFLKGVGINELWRESLALFVFGISILTLSVLRFRKRLG
ncbi:MAG: ABC transporter permease [Bacteroidota bacterium]